MNVPMPLLAPLCVLATVGLACLGFVAAVGLSVWREYAATKVRA